MMDYVVKECAELIAKKLNCGDQMAEIMEALDSFWSDKIAHIWSIADVQEIRPDIDDDQAGRVLFRVLCKLDCTLGITWDGLEFWAEEMFPSQCIDEAEDPHNGGASNSLL